MRAPLVLTLALAAGLAAPAGADPGDDPASAPSPASAEPAPAQPRLLVWWLREGREASAPAGGRVLIESRTDPAMARPKVDGPIRRAQDESGAPEGLGGPGAIPPIPESGMPATPTPVEGGQSISMEAALYGAITSNPDLIILRQGAGPGGGGILNAPSPEAVEVARRFPVALNPTLWIDYRPITLVPNGTFGNGTPGGSGNGTTTGTTGSGAGSGHHGFYHFGQDFIYLSLRQPVELGHQTTSRFEIARAALDQQHWTVVQAEMLALVQTYRFFQTAAYRREKLRVARQLADFNDRLVESLRRRLAANQGVAADVVLARVEARATRQAVRAAQQDYVTALTDLRNQLGIPEAAGAVEPLGEFTLPPYIPTVEEPELIQMALQTRPEIRAARAQVQGTQAAVRLARGDRIPTPIIGPEYQMDEAGVQYVGFVLISPVPIWNNGRPLQRQREAEARRACEALRQAEQRTVAQVRAAIAKWNGAMELVRETDGLTQELGQEVARLERLFEENQPGADLARLLQARQRLIQLENARLDAVWAATQAQADLLLALGAPALASAAQALGGTPPPQ